MYILGERIGKKGKGDNKKGKGKGKAQAKEESRMLVVSRMLCAMYAFYVHIIRTVIGTVMD